ncbi:MAG: tetratricopeptide repeat protein, partial [bacterium]
IIPSSYNEQDTEDNNQALAALVTGQGGVGKTRLIAHFLAHDLPGTFSTITVQGDPYAEGLPFSTILPLFDHALGFRDSEDRPESRRELEQQSKLSSRQVKLLSRVYNLGETDSSKRSSDSDYTNYKTERSDQQEDDEAQQLISDLAQFILDYLGDTPTVLAVDDAQWSDRRSLELLAALIRKQNPPEHQLPLVMDSRPSGVVEDPETLEDIPDDATRTDMYLQENVRKRDNSSKPRLKEIMELEDDVIRIDLSPLQEQTIRAVVENTFPDAQIPEGFIQSIEERTGGLAIHIEQVLWSLHDQELIYLDNGQWIIQKEANDVPLPATLHDLIVSRVDRLGELPRQTLLVSSVLGVNFESWFLEEVVETDRETLDQNIELLLDRGFLRAREDEYIFQHSTIQEVTYDLLLEEDRKKFHRRASKVLRKHLSMDDPSSRDRLASHYREAEDWENWFKLRIQGIEASLRNYSLDEADRLANDILNHDWEEHLSDSWKSRLFHVLGRLRLQQYELDEAREFIQRSLDHTDDDDFEAIAMREGNLGRLFEQQGELDTAAEHIEKALELDREANNDTGVAMRLGALGRLKMKQDEYKEAMELNSEALEMDRKLNNRKGEAIRLSVLGQIEKELGDFQAAMDYFEQSLAIERENNNQKGKSILLGQMGKVAEESNDLEEAEKYYEEALETDREMGNEYGESYQLGALGQVAEQRGNFDEAIDWIEQAITVNESLGNKRTRAYQLGTLGRLYRKKGQPGQGIEYLTEAIDINRELGDEYGEAIHLSTMANIQEDFGDFREAISFKKP